ncbi:sulfatase-like hydrolase/transferase [Acuticoccus kandeliae]|uniref:sulfatase-like hydrolase/transferase n=1 Tax=Acuticoccus kandeliae TaxID=2073160 RepID=UPI000D3E9391|nr:sulfatase-like hydrolase/transferase [Acuticoccus kandeliae]
MEATLTRPDILFVAIDDMNDWTGWLGGHPWARTPNLDALAAQSFRFNRAMCPTPYCKTSRLNVMLGTSPHVSGLISKDVADWMSTLAPYRTIAGTAHGEGYHTVGAGKLWHSVMPKVVLREDPDAWDEFFDVGTNPSAEGEPASAIYRGWPANPNPAPFDWGGLDRPMNDWRDAKAVRHISEKLFTVPRDKPLFAGVGFNKPHLPWQVPPEFAAPFLGGDIPVGPDIDPAAARLPRTAVDWVKKMANFVYWPGRAGEPPVRGTRHEVIKQSGQWAEAARWYLASIYWTDFMFGLVWAALKNAGRDENTIVVVWTDHGHHLGEMQHWGKYTLWERSLRVPFLVRVPEAIRKARGLPPPCAIETPVSTTSTFATLADLCGWPVPDHPAYCSRSLLPLIGRDAPSEAAPVLSAWNPGNWSLRWDHYRYTRYGSGPAREEELYDYAVDPHETTNRVTDKAYDQVRARLSATLDEMLVNAPAAALVDTGGKGGRGGKGRRDDDD